MSPASNILAPVVSLYFHDISSRVGNHPKILALLPSFQHSEHTLQEVCLTMLPNCEFEKKNEYPIENLVKRTNFK